MIELFETAKFVRTIYPCFDYVYIYLLFLNERKLIAKMKANKFFFLKLTFMYKHFSQEVALLLLQSLLIHVFMIFIFVQSSFKFVSKDLLNISYNA
jgi:hypothetical protein